MWKQLPKLAAGGNFGVDTTHWFGRLRIMRSVLKQIAWVGLLLTLLSAFGFAAHQHSSFGDEAQCTICVAAHSASPVAASNLPRVVLFLNLLIVLARPASAKQRLVPFALTVRPPPAA